LSAAGKTEEETVQNPIVLGHETSPFLNTAHGAGKGPESADSIESI
jgi:hypothetical protein